MECSYFERDGQTGKLFRCPAPVNEALPPLCNLYGWPIEDKDPQHFYCFRHFNRLMDEKDYQEKFGQDLRDIQKLPDPQSLQ